MPRKWGLWLVKHVVGPLDRLVVKLSRSRLPPPSSLLVPSLLLTVVGRRTGRKRTIPLVYVRDGTALLVGNARPAGERRNPWVFNLRSAGLAEVNLDGRTFAVKATELSGESLERAWRLLAGVWPQFADHYETSGERSVFLLEPGNGGHIRS